MNEIVPSRKGRVCSNGIEIYFEAFGKPEDPAVLLIAGMDTPCTIWFPYIYQPIVQAGYHVVRFDNRDCGRSGWIEDWDPNNPYILEDMALDTLGLMDALDMESAHLVGASMGGMIAQCLAIRNPHRVLTLSSIASTGFALDPDPDLRSTQDMAQSIEMQETLEARYPNRLTAPEETIEYCLVALREFSGSRFPFEEELYRKMLEENILEHRGFNPLAQAHHLAAVVASGSRLDELGRIQTPALVIHGTEDPLLAPGHAVKCASLIPKARLVWMEGVGHELPSGIMGLLHDELFQVFLPRVMAGA